MATPDDISDDERDALEAALPGYNVGAVLGRGAHGVVVGGWHVGLGRAVAIKQLAPHLVGDEAARSRFESEARLLAALDHPHIVPVYDYVADGPLCLLVMEHMVGGSVADRLASRSFAPDVACATVLAICAGLQYAHERGVVHRDIKPVNVLYAATSTVKIADFGIAKVVDGTARSVTVEGAVLGTPAYLAPEQARGEPTGPQVDVYAAGVVLFELLSDRMPFPEDLNPTAAVYRRAHEPAQRLSVAAPSVPAAIAAVVDRALASSLADRFATVDELGVALAEAGGEVWGGDWLHRSGMPNVVSANLLRAAGGGRPRSRDVDARSATRATPPAPSTSRTGGPSLDVVAGPVVDRRTGRDRRVRRVVAAAAGVVLALGGAGVLLLRQDDGGATTGATTGPSGSVSTSGSTTDSTTDSTEPTGSLPAGGGSTPAGSIPNVPFPPGDGPAFQPSKIATLPMTGISAMAAFPSDARLATATESGQVLVWDLNDLAQEPTTLDLGAAGFISALAVSGDGALLAAVANNGVSVWDVATGELVGPPMVSEHGATSIAFNGAAVFFLHEPNEIVIGGFDGVVQRWDPATGTPVGLPMVGHTSSVNSVAYNLEGTLIASGSEDATIRTWVRSTGAAAGPPLLGHVGAVTSVVFDLASAFIVSASRDQTVRIWNISAGTELGDPRSLAASNGFFPTDPVVSMATSQRSISQQAIAVIGDGGLTFWDLASDEVLGGLPTSSAIMQFTLAYAVVLEQGGGPDGPPSAVAVVVDADGRATVYAL